MVVLVPSTIPETLTISYKHVSPEYLAAMAKEVWTTLLNVTPKNVHFAREAMLRLVHSGSYAALDKQLTELVQDLEQREVSTHFIPMDMEEQADALTVEVTGYLETYLGTEQVSQELKSYHVKFMQTGTTLLLTEFGEIKDEK